MILPARERNVRRRFRVESFPFVDDVEIREFRKIRVSVTNQPGRFARFQQTNVFQFLDHFWPKVLQNNREEEKTLVTLELEKSGKCVQCQFFFRGL